MKRWLQTGRIFNNRPSDNYVAVLKDLACAIRSKSELKVKELIAGLSVPSEHLYKTAKDITYNPDLYSNELLKATHQQLSEKLVAAEVQRDGNCLFNAASLLIAGNESLAAELRLRTCVELISRKSEYLAHPFSQQASLLSSCYNTALQDCATNHCSVCIWSLWGLASVIQREIISVYPTIDERNDPVAARICNVTVKPLSPLSPQAKAIYIMWTSTGPYQSSPWRPNHFAPLLQIPHDFSKNFPRERSDTDNTIEKDCSPSEACVSEVSARHVAADVTIPQSPDSGRYEAVVADDIVSVSVNGDECTVQNCCSKSPLAKRSRAWYSQPFNSDWMQIPELKDWVKPDPLDKYTVHCSFCDYKLKNPNKSALLKHAVSTKHCKAFESKKGAINVSELIKKRPESTLKQKVAKAELQLVAFMAEHHMPFAQADHLTETLKVMFPDSDIAKSLSLKKTKASYVMQDGIASNEQHAIIDICRNQKFSLIIDESTDVSTSQILAMVVRFFDMQSMKVVDAFIGSIEVDDGSAEGLYRAVKHFLTSNGIPLINIIGFASDNCSTMLGINGGFQALLKKDVPDVFVLGCICHSLALCASAAAAVLPSWLEAFLKNVCFYFSRSSKRQHAFSSIQDIFQCPKHKMLKLSQTRWLSRGNVVTRILEQWDALELFFQSESKHDKIDGAGNIYHTMKTLGTKHMLLFLNYVLSKVDAMNTEFQSSNLRIHKVYSTIACEYRNLLSLYIRPDVINSHDLVEIDPTDESLIKPLREVCVGGRCEALLLQASLNENDKRFRTDCVNFLKELCLQISKRFPLASSSLLAQMCILDASEATSYDRKIKSIIPIAIQFANVVQDRELDRLQEQWLSLPNVKNAIMANSVINDSAIPAFWYRLRSITDGNNVPKFDLLSHFMCSLLALPHSSACVERIFSQINLVKNCQSNRLSIDAAANRLLARQAISRTGEPCYKWRPEHSLIEDVAHGGCHKRYKERQLLQLAQNTISVHHIDEDGDDDDDSAFLIDKV